MIGTSQLINTFSRPCFTDTTDIFKDGSGVALYGLDYDASDAGGASGKFGEAAIFNGSSSYISAANILDTSSAFSYSFWINPSTISSLDYVIGHQQAGSPYAGISLLGSGSNKLFLSIAGGTAQDMTPSLSLNTWSHIVLTHDGSGNYVCYTNNNGSPISYSGATSNNSSNPFRLGFSSVSGWGYFDGSIDQVRIFNTALTQSQVTQLYQENNSTVGTHLFGCIANYNLDGSAKESMGTTAYDGTETDITYRYDGTPTAVDFGVGGKSNYGARFNGSSSYVTSNSLPSIGTGDFTFSCWFNQNSGSSQGALFSTTTQWFAANGSVNPKVLMVTDDTVTKKGDTAYSQDTWNHAVFARESGVLKIYQNGTEVFSGAYTDSWDMTQFGIGVARAFGSRVYYFNGEIDQVRIFSKALNQSEVDSLYAETACVYTATTTDNDYPTTNLAYYKLDNSAEDEKGSYDGTETNIEYRFGRFGQAAVFNGSSSEIDLPVGLGASGNRARSFWINVSAFPASGGDAIYYIGQQGVNDDYETLNVRSDGTIRYQERHDSGGAGDLVIESQTTISLNQWYNIIIVFDGLNRSMYINGSTALGNTGTKSTQTVNNSAYAGNLGSFRGVAGTATYDGSIDQVRIFSTALSDSQVAELYNEKPEVDTSNFKAVLYEGNGGTNFISNVGFQPDLVWVKSRDGAHDHVLYDTVRGVGSGKALSSNANYAEGAYDAAYGFLDTFEATGPVVKTGSSYANYTNKNNESYVAWNWKGGGLLNKSAYFNGSGYIDTGYTTGSGTAASISCWVNIEAYTTYGGFVGDSTGASSASRFFIGQGAGTAGKLWVSIGNGSSSWYDETTVSLTSYGLNKWFHLVGTVDGTTVKIYINGSLVHTYTSSVSYSGAGTFPYYLGGWGNSLRLQGKLDQVRFFNKAISLSEVGTLYNESASTLNTLQVLGDTSCTAAFPLQNGATSIGGTYSGSSSAVTFNNPGHLTRNTSGTIESTVSANTEAGFSIVKYTGNGTAGATVGHGLSSAPELIIGKRLVSSGGNWTVFAEPVGATAALQLNTTIAAATATAYFNDTAPTDSVFTLGSNANLNNTEETIAYCFHSVAGYSKIGSYTGGGATNVPVSLGFQPRFVIIKRATGGNGNWMMYDNVRQAGTIPYDNYTILLADDSYQEQSDNTIRGIQFTSDGFILNKDYVLTNNSGSTYIYMAFK